MIYKLHVDSSAAKALMQRSGVGKVKHIDVRSLWLQAERELHGMVVCKTPGEQNPADLGTKVHGRKRFEYLRELVGIVDCSVVAERPLNEIAALSWDVVGRRKPPMRMSGSAGLMKKLLMMSSLAGAAAIDTVQVATSSDGELSGMMIVSLILACVVGFLLAMMIYPVRFGVAADVPRARRERDALISMTETKVRLDTSIGTQTDSDLEAPEKRTAMTMSQTTYKARGYEGMLLMQPRFTPLGAADQGAWVYPHMKR